jgi:hypothetical protein
MGDKWPASFFLGRRFSKKVQIIENGDLKVEFDLDETRITIAP